MTARIQTLAHEMVSLLRSLEPAIGRSFFRGATEADLRRMEDTTSHRLPNELRGFWKSCDGQNMKSHGIYDGDFLFLSVEAAREQWLTNKDVYEASDDWIEFEADPEVKAEVWNRGWIPFAWAPNGDTLLLHLSPNLPGQIGQVISTPVEGAHRALLARSFGEWLDVLVSDLRNGRITTDPNHAGAVIHERRTT